MSTTRRTLLAMMTFGLLMGIIFPFYAAIFTTFKPGMLVPFVIGCVVAGVVVGAVSYQIARTLVFRKVAETAQALRDIRAGDGDLTRRLDTSSADELGELAEEFNGFVAKLQKIIKEMALQAPSLSASSAELSAVSQEISGCASRTSRQTQEVEAMTGRASESVGDISAKARALAGGVSSVAVSVSEMSATLLEVSRSCQEELRIAVDAQNRARMVQEMMGQFGVTAAGIGKVVGFINEIAERTNLLALNATLEAVGAGAAGKGFAVVANEVKELARQTGKATQEIGKQIETMQEWTLKAAAAVQDISRVIDSVNAISHTIGSAVEEQSAAIREISRNVQEMDQGAGRISADVGASAAGLSGISSSIGQVRVATEETSSGVENILESARELSKLAVGLERIVSQFRV